MFPANSDGCSSTSGQQQQQQQHRSREQSCYDLENESGQLCAENETFLILGQFEKLYKNRLAEVEVDADATNAQVAELKLKIMTDWVEDLGEQNKMLVKTVHELEQAAISRVKLLENKLQETSTLMSHNMSHSNKSEEDLNTLSNCTNTLLHDQNDMQQKIDYLQNDVKNLLELIKRGRQENNWDLDGIKFYLIQPSDIPAPSKCSCSQITNVPNNEERALIAKLRDELHITKAEMNKLKDEHKSEVNNLLLNIDEKYNEIEHLVTRLACLDKEKNITGVNQDSYSLIEEVAHKENLICDLKNIIVNHEKTIEDLMKNYCLKNFIICELKNKLKNALKKNNEKLKFSKSSDIQCTQLLPYISKHLCVKLKENECITFGSIYNISRKMCEKRYPNLDTKINNVFKCNHLINCQQSRFSNQPNMFMDCSKLIKQQLDQTILKCIK